MDVNHGGSVAATNNNGYSSSTGGRQSSIIESNITPRPPPNNRVAIVFGVTGLVGKELARKLIISTSNWKVYGVARRKPDDNSNNHLQLQEAAAAGNKSNYHFISCDLLNPLQTHQKLSKLKDVTHMFWITWASKDFPLDDQECCICNKAMMSNALDALLPAAAASLKHVSIQTGMKHYISLQPPFTAAAADIMDRYHEESPRVATSPNFYYVLEDLVKERLNNNKPAVSWSVHRPGLIMGCSTRSWFNCMGSICVYGTICRHLGLPFVFGGTRQCWEEVCMDASDARLVAEQHIWAATTSTDDDDTFAASVNGQAFNSINGTSFTWKQIWPRLADKFGLAALSPAEEMFLEDYRFSVGMADMSEVWKQITTRHGLIDTKMCDLANWGFLDMLFRCPFKLLGTRDKANMMGFKLQYQTLDSILYWVDAMKNEKLIP